MNKKILKTIGIISIPFMYFILFFAIKYIPYIVFSYDLLFFATLGFIYVSLHFFLDIKKMYDWIFNHRYLIGIIIFMIFVIGGYHGSSINMWDRYVNPDYKLEDGTPIIGIARGIRSDEWMVSTPHNLSQTLDSVDLNKNNDLMKATENIVNFYPRLIVRDLGILLHPEHIGYLFLPRENAFSFGWYFCYFAAFFVALELLMLITKKKKLYSCLGAFLLVISSANLWWNSCGYILYGGLAILVINKFINTKDVKLRILLSVILGWIAGCYVAIMYPAWMIPYAYLFALIFVWLLIENKNKINWKDLLYLIITALVFIVLFVPLYLDSKEVYEVVSNTVYPGKRIWTGGNGDWKLLFNYVVAIFFPYTKAVTNPCELSQHLSLFPIPLIMGFYHLIENKKKHKKIDWFLLFMCLYASFLTIMCLVPLPGFISKITLLYMSTCDRAQLVVGYCCIFIMIYLMSKYEKKSKIKNFDRKQFKFLILSVLSSAVVTYLAQSSVNIKFNNAINIYMCLISFIMFVFAFYLLFRNNKTTNFLMVLVLIFINTISILLVHPLDKGLEILYEKPFAKKIQNLVNENPDAKFLTTNGFITLQNYILVNGGKSINSTNFVPNLELWYKLDPYRKYNYVYNRYTNVSFSLVDTETKFTLLQVDHILVSLSYDDICLTGANYLVTDQKLNDNSEYYLEIYNEYGIYIYETTCLN